MDKVKEKIINLGYELEYVLLEWNLFKEIVKIEYKCNRRIYTK